MTWRLINGRIAGLDGSPVDILSMGRAGPGRDSEVSLAGKHTMDARRRFQSCGRALIASLCLALISPPLAAETPTALGGHDPVSYFDQGAVSGNAQWSAVHGGQTYRFASRANRDRFQRQPERYAPAYDGHCAYGVRMGKLLAVDYNAYEIVDGRLFLLLNRATQALWQEQKQQNIAIADRLWPELRPPAHSP